MTILLFLVYGAVIGAAITLWVIHRWVVKPLQAEMLNVVRDSVTVMKDMDERVAILERKLNSPFCPWPEDYDDGNGEEEREEKSYLPDPMAEPMQEHPVALPPLFHEVESSVMQFDYSGFFLGVEIRTLPEQ